MSQYFPKPHDNYDGNINFELDLSYYKTKANLKVVAGVGISNLAAKSDFLFSKLR